MSVRSSQPDATPSDRTIRLADRIRVEAVRHRRMLDATPVDDAQAVEQARAAHGSVERRLITYADAVPGATDLNDALRRIVRLAGIAIGIAMLISLLAGIGTARAAIGGGNDDPVNIFTVLTSLLGIQLLLLLVWIAVMVLAPRSRGGGLLGPFVLEVVRVLARRFAPDTNHVAAVQAYVGIIGNGRLGRWTLSGISHAMWLAFTIGTVATVVTLLAVRHYTLGWETTILSDEAYISLTTAISAVPNAVGFETPTIEQIRASQLSGDLDAAAASNQAWSSLLIASLLLYGVVPRGLALAFSMMCRSRAARAHRIDVHHPEIQRLAARLQPVARSIGIVDPDDARPIQAAGDDAPSIGPGEGPLVIVGFELVRRDTTWPPALRGVTWTDLGIVETGAEQRAVAERIEALPVAPGAVVIVVSMTTTPDRGVRAFLAKLVAVAGGPVVLVLSSGDVFRRRSEGQALRQRLDDWMSIATAAGIGTVVDVDLDHLTDASRGRLLDTLGRGGEVRPTTDLDGLAEAFARIRSEASTWEAVPTLEQQAELHRQIARIFSGTSDWRRLLGMATEGEVDVRAMLGESASTMQRLLPPRLRAETGWLTAGAAAGAFGCIAAAALVAPAAIGALPLWTGLGAGLTAAMRIASSGRSDATSGEPTELADRDAIRAATLFGVLLSIQGLDEHSISTILDRSIPTDGPEATDLAGWLSRILANVSQAVSELSS